MRRENWIHLMKKSALTKSIAFTICALLLVPQPAFAADSGGGTAPAPGPAPVVVPTPTPTPTPAPVVVPTPTPTPTVEPTAMSVVASKTLDGELMRIRDFIYVQNYKMANANLLLVNKEFPNDADVNNLLGFTARKMKQYGPAATYYLKALSINSQHLGALEYQGELFIITKKIALAKKNLTKLKKLCGLNCEEYLDLKKAIGKR
jgi:tetratricopeptide (TPR) repeat protein